MATEIQTIKASQLEELTEVTDSNYVVVTDGATSKKVKATNLKGNSLTSTQQQQLNAAYAHSQSTHVQSSDIPTRTSQLTNDSGFATESTINDSINRINEQLDTNVRELNNKINEVATTGTTEEVVQNKVSEMAQNGSITFNTITPEMTTFINESGYKQLLNYSLIEFGKYYNNGNEVVSDNTYGIISLTLDKEEHYLFTGISSSLSFLELEDGTHISFNKSTGYGSYLNTVTGLSADYIQKIIIPKNCTKVKLSVRKVDSMSKPMIFKTTDEILVKEYIPYNKKLNSSLYINNLKYDYDELGTKLIKKDTYKKDIATINNNIKANTDKLSFCTDRIIQYLRKENKKDGYYYDRNATNENMYVSGAGNSIYSKINIVKGTTYYYKDLYAYFCIIVYEDGSRVNLSSSTSTRVSGSFTADKNGYILITTSNNATEITSMFANGEIIWNKYTEGQYQYCNGLFVPYKDIIDIPTEFVNLHVIKNGNGDFVSFVEAIKSITDSSINKQYNVFLYDDHDIIAELGGQSYIESLTSSSDRASIYIPEYVNVIGIGLRTLSGKINRSWNCNYNAIKAMSTLEVKDGNNKFKNLIITAQNMRYAVHDESSGSKPNMSVEWENCKFIHYGNDDFSTDTTGQWLSSCAYGSGVSSANYRKFKHCIFRSKSFYPFSVHDNYNFKYGAYLYFNDCEFYNEGGNPTYYQSVKLATFGTGNFENTASFNNCLLNDILVRNEVSGQPENRWRVKGSGNYRVNIADSGKQIPFTITI